MDRLNPVVVFLSKLIFSAAVVCIVFRPKKIRQFAKITLIFYLVSFALGGITIGLMYFLGIWGLTQNSTVYMGGLGYFYILLGCTLTYFIFTQFSHFIKGRLVKERTYADVKISMDGKETTVVGMVDTGNFLKDPLTGKPVLIISAKAAEKILPSDFVEEAVRPGDGSIISELLMKSSYANRVRLIPYQSIGREKGFLIGIRPDSIRIGLHNSTGQDQTLISSEGAVLAIYKGIISGGQSDEDCSILLHPSLIEGGIACDV